MRGFYPAKHHRPCSRIPGSPLEKPEQAELRGLVKCGHCGVSVSCHKMRGRNGAFNYYYYCRNHDPLRAGGEHRRCQERNIRADALDGFVFDQVRAAMLRPNVLLTGEAAVSRRRRTGDDGLLDAQVARFNRRIDSAAAERRRLADLYQANFIEREELLRRGKELELRCRTLEVQRQTLIAQRDQLAQLDRLRDRVEGFADKVRATIDQLDFDQRQKLLRLVIDEIRVTGWQVEIRFRIPLDDPPDPPGKPVSSKDHLRSLRIHRWRVLSPQGSQGAFRTARPPAPWRQVMTKPIFTVPTYWTPEQALAVYEILDDLRQQVWAIYNVRLQDQIRRQRQPSKLRPKKIKSTNPPC